MKRSKMTSFIPGLEIHNKCIWIESKFDSYSIEVYIEVIQGQKRSFGVKNAIYTIYISIERIFHNWLWFEAGCGAKFDVDSEFDFDLVD